MKLFAVLAFTTLSFSAFSQTCYVDMVNRYDRVVRTFQGWGDPGSCVEGMKECRKAIRFQPELGGVDCIRDNARPQPQPIPNPYPNPNPNPRPQPRDILQQAIDGYLNRCFVLPGVSGYNQLYVDYKFAGNYSIGHDDQNLRIALMNRQYQGVCTEMYQPDPLIQRLPYLIQDFSNQQYRNCYVIRNSGYNQFYVNGQFKGNYSPSDDHTLSMVLLKSIVNGVCY